MTQITLKLPDDLTIRDRLNISPNELGDLCQQWGIVEISLFGSILRDDFHKNSDIDLLITLAPDVPQGLLTLAKIKRQLEDQLKRTVDLVIKESVQNSDNWIRRQEILNTAVTIYESR